MCLSVPARVLEVHDEHWATVDVGGTSKRISIDLVEELEAGDYVLLHVGFALQKLDEEEARKTLELMEELAASGALDGDGAAGEEAALFAMGGWEVAR